MRLIPESLSGRLVLILLAGLAIAQGAGIWLHQNERQALVMHARMQSLLDRVAEAVPVLEATPPPQRPGVLAQLQRSGLSVQPIAPEQVAAALPPAPVALALAQRLGAQRELRTPVAASPRADSGPLGSIGAGRREEIAAGPLDLKLADGQWLRFSVPPPALEGGAPDAFVRQMLIALAVVVGVSLLAVRHVTQPLRQLAAAADALGHNLDAPPLPDTGPLETRQAVHAFNGMQERLRRLVADRSRALAAVSHDLRTPLTRLRLRAELVPDVQLREQIVGDVDDMQAMIDATLEYLRDLRSEAPRVIDFNALLGSLVEDERSLGRNVTLSGEALAPFVGRLSALKRAIGNLVGNAIKYAGAAELRLVDEGARLLLCVEDRGPGIPPAELARVTEPYYRVETSRSRETGGVGLGLAIARDVAVMHGGELRLENRAGGGLSATLVLPRSE